MLYHQVRLTTADFTCSGFFPHTLIIIIFLCIDISPDFWELTMFRTSLSFEIGQQWKGTMSDRQW